MKKTLFLSLISLVLSATALAQPCDLKFEQTDNEYQMAVRMAFAFELNACELKESDLEGDVQVLKILDENPDICTRGGFYDTARTALKLIREEKAQ